MTQTAPIPPAMLTAQQVRWAASHDWFVRDNGDGSVKVRDVTFDCEADVITETELDFRNFRRLRDWAGY